MGQTKDEIKAYQQEKIQCPKCGATVSRNGHWKHKQTLKCRGLSPPKQTKEQKYAYNRRYRADPVKRDKRRKKQLEYYYKNRYRWLVYNDPSVQLVEKKPIILYFN